VDDLVSLRADRPFQHLILDLTSYWRFRLAKIFRRFPIPAAGCDDVFFPDIAEVRNGQRAGGRRGGKS
jgi:hypothetical protein